MKSSNKTINTISKLGFPFAGDSWKRGVWGDGTMFAIGLPVSENADFTLTCFLKGFMYEVNGWDYLHALLPLVVRLTRLVKKKNKFFNGVIFSFEDDGARLTKERVVTSVRLIAALDGDFQGEEISVKILEKEGGRIFLCSDNREDELFCVGGAYYSLPSMLLTKTILLQRQEIALVNLQEGKSLPDLKGLQAGLAQKIVSQYYSITFEDGAQAVGKLTPTVFGGEDSEAEYVSDTHKFQSIVLRSDRLKGIQRLLDVEEIPEGLLLTHIDEETGELKETTIVMQNRMVGIPTSLSREEAQNRYGVRYDYFVAKSGATTVGKAGPVMDEFQMFIPPEEILAVWEDNL